MKLKRVVVLSLLLLFSLGSVALGGTPPQNNNKHRMENRGNGNGNKGNRRKHWRRRHRRHRRNRM